MRKEDYVNVNLLAVLAGPPPLQLSRGKLRGAPFESTECILLQVSIPDTRGRSSNDRDFRKKLERQPDAAQRRQYCTCSKGRKRGWRGASELHLHNAAEVATFRNEKWSSRVRGYILCKTPSKFRRYVDGASFTYLTLVAHQRDG
ncbi:hypothetical protein QAD02_005831 [Eretmocerus hayati]|uniref:Uncharacterized protein n=1 Tax=Eretmocerus hayati TaxID=131215 RepID=A0ACC2NW93_9HYME|nr:hypothetical protein QAD02_005831 [Eretmocerus hayati]